MASQKARIPNTAAGRAIFHRTRTATELRALDGHRSLPPEVRSKIKANPIPKHVSHELHEGRRKARVYRPRRQFKGGQYVTYVDVAAYPAGGLFAVAAVNGRGNSLTLAASVRAETPAAAETIAAALVIKQHDRAGREVHVVTDSQQACMGTCLPVYGQREGETCQQDADCERGLSCLQPGPGGVRRVCQQRNREMRKKQFSSAERSGWLQRLAKLGARRGM
ncbi:hypothetical protein HPB49_026098 [Dermacentor silvarum]|nr:hypothetical protein HPB49_026098 [Dermacentor silvarum]